MVKRTTRTCFVLHVCLYDIEYCSQPQHFLRRFERFPNYKDEIDIRQRLPVTVHSTSISHVTTCRWIDYVVRFFYFLKLI